MDQETPIDRQATIIQLMEEHQNPTYSKVVEFLESKMEVLNIEEGDVNKFVEVPGPNFFNLTEEMLTRGTGNFGLKHATADNISSVVGALNMLREAENKLRRFDLSLESAVTLVRNLESEQRLPAETVLNNHLENVHIGDERTRWRFKEKLALLEAILGVHAGDTNKMFWGSIGPMCRKYSNNINRSDDACRNHWKVNWVDKKREGTLEWLGKK